MSAQGTGRSVPRQPKRQSGPVPGHGPTCGVDACADCWREEFVPLYTGDEPLGTCVIHGDYWTDYCLRCGS